ARSHDCSFSVRFYFAFFFFSSRRRHTRSKRDWSSDVCSSDLLPWLQGFKLLGSHGLEGVHSEHRLVAIHSAGEVAALPRRHHGGVVVGVTLQRGNLGAEIGNLLIQGGIFRLGGHAPDDETLERRGAVAHSVHM